MIKEVENKDFNDIYVLGSLLHENYKETNNLDELIKSDVYKIYVYKDENEVKGFLSFVVFDDIIDIYDIVVNPKCRREGIATSLFEKLFENYPHQNVLVDVNVKNIEALFLYEKLGFKNIHTRKKYYGENDAYIMERSGIDDIHSSN